MSEDEAYLFDGGLANPSPRLRAALTRKQSLRSLPQPLFGYDRERKELFGAFVVHQCIQSARADQILFFADRFVALSQSQPLTPDLAKYVSCIFSLTESGEQRVRSGATVLGTALNHQFVEFAGVRWKAFTCSKAQREALMRSEGGEVRFECPATWARIFGVVPDAAVAAPAAAASSSSAALNTAVVNPAEESQIYQSVADDSQNRALSEVGSNLDGMSKTHAQGNVDHRFEPDALLRCLQLSHCIRPGFSLRDALAASAPILHGAQGNALAAALESGEHPIPSISLMRAARLRLDFLSIMFERRLFMNFYYRRYLLIDSSPQLGFNMLCVREDRVRFPRGSFGADFRKAYDLSANFESRICPLSTLGAGHAGLVKKRQEFGKHFVDGEWLFEFLE
jgi:hypothetical protein